jgi:hypothetical protein
MKIFPTNIIKELDQYTIQNEPINSPIWLNVLQGFLYMSSAVVIPNKHN